MFIADELVKILICELCIENYNEKEKIPLSLYPCNLIININLNF